MAQIKVTTGAAAPTPPPGKLAIYAKIDKRLYYKDDSGVETVVVPGAGGSVKFHLRLGDSIIVAPDFQYVVKSPGPIIDAGASLTVLPGGQLVVIP